jgi:hypothetical protein
MGSWWRTATWTALGRRQAGDARERKRRRRLGFGLPAPSGKPETIEMFLLNQNQEFK